MLLWHVGVAALVTYVTLGRRRIDYRFVLLGAVLPDVIDATLAAFFFEWPAGRGIAHSLLAVVVVAVVVVVVFSGEQRLSVFGVAVGWLLHLVADGMWQAPLTFLWPAFGPRFSVTPAEPYSWDVFTDPLDHVATWGGEVAGILIVAWFSVAFGLGDRARLKLFLKDGRLRP